MSGWNSLTWRAYWITRANIQQRQTSTERTTMSFRQQWFGRLGSGRSSLRYSTKCGWDGITNLDARFTRVISGMLKSAKSFGWPMWISVRSSTPLSIWTLRILINIFFYRRFRDTWRVHELWGVLRGRLSWVQVLGAARREIDHACKIPKHDLVEKD